MKGKSAPMKGHTFANSHSVSLGLDSPSELVVTYEPAEGRALPGATLKVTLDNVKGDITCTPNDELLLIEKDTPSSTTTKHVYNCTVSDSSELESSFLVSGQDIVDVEVPVLFQPDPDVLSISVTPTSAKSAPGVPMTLTVSGTSRPIVASITGPGVIKSKGDYQYEVIGNDIGDCEVTIQGKAVVTQSKTLTVIPQFKPEVDVVETDQNALPYSVKILDLEGDELNVNSNNSGELKVSWDKSSRQVSFQATAGNYEKEITAVITMSSTGYKNVELPVTIALPTDIPVIPINGNILRAKPNEQVFIQFPTLDYNDSIDCTSTDSPSKLTIEKKTEPNRYYITPLELGTYTIVVKHNEYKPGKVTLICEEPPKGEVVDYDGKPVFDLGVAPETTLSTLTDDFVTDVFTSTAYTTDSERLAVVIARGPKEYRDLGNKLCTYAEKMSVLVKPEQPVTSEEGADFNYELYRVLMNVFNIKDYYVFREQLKLVLKIFKHYKKDAMKDMNLLRYEKFWKAGDKTYTQYKELIKFLVNYVSKNGQGIKPYNVPLNEFAIKNLEMFCGENIEP